MSSSEFGPRHAESSAPRAFSGAETTPSRPKIRSIEGERPPRTSTKVARVRSFPKRLSGSNVDQERATRENEIREQTIRGAITGVAKRGETLEYGWARYHRAGTKEGKTIIHTSLLPQREQSSSETATPRQENTTQQPQSTQEASSPVAGRAETQASTGELRDTYMEGLYDNLDMGNGNDRDAVERRAKELWEGNSDLSLRAEIVETLVGRRIREDEMDKLPDALFKSVYFGTSYESLASTIDEIREHDKENPPPPPSQEAPPVTKAPPVDTVKPRPHEGKPNKKEFAIAPPGTVVEEIDQNVVDNNRAKMKYWARIEVDFTGIEPGENKKDQVPENPGIPLDAALLPYQGAYEYKVVAEPFTDEEVRNLKFTAEGKHDDVEPGRGGAISLADEADKQKVLSDELKRDEYEGRFHRPSIIVGAQTAGELKEVANIIAGSARTKLPYTVNINPRNYASYDNAVANIPEPDAEGYEVPEPEYDKEGVGVSAEMLRRFIAIPEGEVYGVVETSREPFAVHTGFEDDYELHPGRYLNVGTIEDRYGNDAGDLIIPKAHLDKHIGVWAASGAGKTRLLQMLTVEAATGEEARPVLFVDPKGKQEGSPTNAKILADMLEPHGIKVAEINPANLLLEGGGDNPMDPQGAPLATYVNDLITVLSNAFGSKPGQDDNISAEVTTRFLTDAIKGKRDSEFKGIYERFGWDIITGKPLVPGSNPKYPTLWDLIDVATEAVEAQEYKGEAQNIKPFLEQRIHQLNTGISGVFFGGEQMDWGKIFDPQDETKVTVFDISELDSKDQALVMGMVLLRKQRFLKHNKGARCVTVLDEINTLVESDPHAPEGPLTARINRIFSQIREFKGGLIVAGQEPNKVPTAIVQNIGTHFPMRNKGEEGGKALKVPTRLTDEQLEELTTYPDRSTVMLTDGMPYPVRGYTRDTNTLPVGEGAVQKPSSKFKREVDEQPSFSDEEKTDLRRVLEYTREGGKLLALTDTITASTLMGLDPIRINYDKLRAEGKDYFANLRGRDQAEKNYLVRQAAERAILSRSQKILRPDIPVEDYIQHIEEQVHAAINDDPIPKAPVQHITARTDENGLVHQAWATYALPEYWMMPIKAELVHFLALADEQGIDQSSIGRHPESNITVKPAQNGQPEEIIEGELVQMFQGAEIPGETVSDQLDYLHYAIPTTQMLVLAKNSRSGHFILDRGIGQKASGAKLTEAIDKHEDEETWLREYADFLKELTVNQRTSSTLYNEVVTHVEQQITAREKRKQRERPSQQAQPQQVDGTSPAEIAAAVGSTVAQVLFERDQSNQEHTGNDSTNAVIALLYEQNQRLAAQVEELARRRNTPTAEPAPKQESRDDSTWGEGGYI